MRNASPSTSWSCCSFLFYHSFMLFGVIFVTIFQGALCPVSGLVCVRVCTPSCTKKPSCQKQKNRGRGWGIHMPRPWFIFAWCPAGMADFPNASVWGELGRDPCISVEERPLPSSSYFLGFGVSLWRAVHVGPLEPELPGHGLCFHPIPSQSPPIYHHLGLKNSQKLKLSCLSIMTYWHMLYKGKRNAWQDSCTYNNMCECLLRTSLNTQICFSKMMKEETWLAEGKLKSWNQTPGKPCHCYFT